MVQSRKLSLRNGLMGVLKEAAVAYDTCRPVRLAFLRVAGWAGNARVGRISRWRALAACTALVLPTGPALGSLKRLEVLGSIS